MTEIQNQTETPVPDINFDAIKNSALGKPYTLSVVFVSPVESQRINKEYRKKDKPTNILSFPYSHGAGEIVLCPHVLQKEARAQRMTYQTYVAYIYIHGLIHLSGFDHSVEMEKREIAQRKKFLPVDFERP